MTLICILQRGLSGGERRRVSIAAELLDGADIVFLDEATSGLDALTAAQTVCTLKRFCSESRKMMICTIHQPSVEVFYLFDKVLVLGAGECAFNGAISEIDVFFKSSLRPKANPADVMVFEVERRRGHFVAKWMASALNVRSTESGRSRIDSAFWERPPLRTRQLRRGTVESVRFRAESAPFLLELGLLTLREAVGAVRNGKAAMTRFFQILLFALITGFLWFGVEQDFGRKIECYIFIVFGSVLFGIISNVAVFGGGRLLLRRQFWSGVHGVLSWSLSFMAIEIPRETVHTVLYSAVVLVLTTLDGTFFQIWFTVLLSTLSGGSFGILLGALCSNPAEASLTIPGSLILLNQQSTHSLTDCHKLKRGVAANAHVFGQLFGSHFYALMDSLDLQRESNVLHSALSLHHRMGRRVVAPPAQRRCGLDVPFVPRVRQRHSQCPSV